MRTRIVGTVVFFTALAAVALALSQRPLSIHARFATGEGLAAGAPVRAQGVVVGKLAEVELGPGGDVLVEMEIHNDATDKIPADSVALLAPGGIDLILGDATDRIGPDTILKGYRTLTELRLDTARGTVDKLLDQLQADAEKLGKTLQEKGEKAGEVLRRELERLRKELEKALPEGKDKSTETKSI
ncbi:MAG: MCE family protein [Deferrisomatales bacterium]|nr:MCE family protein [Deferrisomatales bacterium]